MPEADMLWQRLLAATLITADVTGQVWIRSESRLLKEVLGLAPLGLMLEKHMICFSPLTWTTTSTYPVRLGDFDSALVVELPSLRC